MPSDVGSCSGDEDRPLGPVVASGCTRVTWAWPIASPWESKTTSGSPSMVLLAISSICLDVLCEVLCWSLQTGGMHNPRPATGDGTHPSCDGVPSTLCNWGAGHWWLANRSVPRPQRTPFRLNPVELPRVELPLRGLRLIALEETGQMIGFLI